MLLDDEYGRDGWDLGQRWKLLRGRIGGERLDLGDIRSAAPMLDGARDELRPRMWLDARRCGLPDNAEEIGRPHAFDPGTDPVPLRD
jgi:hypothetical protein